MAKQKALFGRWADMQIGAINKLLKPYGCRLVKKNSKQWGDQITLIAQAVEVTPPGVVNLLVREEQRICEHAWAANPDNGADPVCANCGVLRSVGLQ